MKPLHLFLCAALTSCSLLPQVEINSTPTILAPTATPIIVLTPTETAIPNFIWRSDFTDEFLLWDSVGTQGGTTTIVDDPTSSGMGKVLRASIGGGDPAVEERKPWLVYRLYPAKFFPFVSAPCEFQEDVWASRDLVNTGVDGSNEIVVGPDVFDMTDEDGGSWHSAIQATLSYSSLNDGKIFLRLWHQGVFDTLADHPPEFTAEVWHTLRIFLDATGEISLYQDDQLVSQAKLTADSRTGTVGGHPGLYAYQYGSSAPLSGTLLIDNYQMVCW